MHLIVLLFISLLALVASLAIGVTIACLYELIHQRKLRTKVQENMIDIAKFTKRK